MLNSRQKQMIRDLESSAVSLTARQLSTKYGASLRTIRSDISEIAAYLKDRNIEFLRIPGQGMRIIADRPVFDEHGSILKNRDFPYLGRSERVTLLLLNFIFRPNPISTPELCALFDVSKGTVLASIRDGNALIRENRLKISRFQNKGYHLQGSVRNIVKTAESLVRKHSEELIYDTVTDEANGLMPEEDRRKLDETLRFIGTDLSLYISHHYFLGFMLYCLICSSRSRTRKGTLSEYDEKLNSLMTFLNGRFSLDAGKETANMLKHLLNSFTDYSTGSMHGDSENVLNEAITSMIEYVSSSGMYQIDDSETLFIDLLIHLKGTIDALKLGLPRDNPLLDEIKGTYPNEFNLIKSAAQLFSEVYPLKLDDHEAGYLTLYFLRSFDKTEKIQETNVMVVCNTGRSASKLLATRLINNIPDIHIVSMNSIYNINNDPSILDNVDFVISTIPLGEIAKPYVVISPLLQKNEIGKVKEAIWLTRSEIEMSRPVDETAESMLKERQDALESSADKYYNAENMIPFSAMTLIGEVSMNLFYLISELYPKGIETKSYANISGIYAHVLMSIPRWQRKEFIEPAGDEALIRKHRKQYDIIKKYLNEESRRLGIYIPESEIIAILRYYIY